MDQKLKQDLGIGDNLRQLRKDKKLTQADVAREMQLLGCNIGRITYKKMERNLYNIRISELLALKIIFKLDSFDEFFEGLVFPEQ